MKTIGKIAIGLGVTIAVGGLTYLGIREFKKSKKQIEDEEKEADENLEKIGASREKLEKEVKKEDPNSFVTSIFVSMCQNPDVDIDALNIDYALDSESVVHVLKTDFNNGKTTTQQINLFLDIPYYKNRNKRYPKIGEILTAMKSLTNNIKGFINNDEIASKIRSKMIGIVHISGEIEVNEEKQSSLVAIKLPECVYHTDKYATENHDGLSKFYETYYEGGNENHEMDEEILNSLSWANEEERKSAKVENFYLTYQIQLPIKSETNVGVNMFNCVDIIKDILNNFEIVRRDSEIDKIEYKQVMFHVDDLIHFYELMEDGRYFINDIVY